MDCFKDRVVIVTGASSGIGACTAEQFAKHGAKLTIAGRNEANLRKTAKNCEKAGVPSGNILLVAGDLTREDDCNRLIDETVTKYGAIHVLINNAGGLVMGHIDRCTVQDIDHMYNTNLRSTFMTSKRALPHLEATKGAIVNLSSIAGLRSVGYALAYSVAKAAVEQFTKCLANDVAVKGVRVNCVCPGTIITPLFTRPGGHIAHDPETLPQFLDKMATAHPMGRVGDVTEAAAAILWLASDSASFTTGASVPVDGGRHGTSSSPKI